MTDADLIRQIVKDELAQALAVHVYEHHKRRQTDKFTPPTRDEIIAFCRENRVPLSIDKFLNHYEMKGWKVGRTKMSNWHAAARNAAKDWAYWPDAPWMAVRASEKPTEPVKVLSVAERVALREQMEKIGKPVPKLGATASREELDKLEKNDGQRYAETNEKDGEQAAELPGTRTSTTTPTPRMGREIDMAGRNTARSLGEDPPVPSGPQPFDPVNDPELQGDI